MRIKFNDSIFLCTTVSHPKESRLLIITTPNGVYTVDMINCEQAEFVYNILLINGYFDVSGYEYSK